MKRVLCAVVAAAAAASLATPAAAQDANRGGWGCFGDLHFAQREANYKFTQIGKVGLPGGPGTTPSSSASNAYGAQSPDGPGFGVGLGCDWHRGNWVLGAQIQHDSGSLSGNNALTAFPTFNMKATLISLETVTARLGYMVTPDLMAYARTGFAVALNKYLVTLPTGGQSEFASTQNVGFVLGGGLEYNLTDEWSFYGEYDHNNFGTFPYSFVQAVNTVGTADRIRIRESVNQFVFGVHYHF